MLMRKIAICTIAFAVMVLCLGLAFSPTNNGIVPDSGDAVVKVIDNVEVQVAAFASEKLALADNRQVAYFKLEFESETETAYLVPVAAETPDRYDKVTFKI